MIYSIMCLVWTFGFALTHYFCFVAESDDCSVKANSLCITRETFSPWDDARDYCIDHGGDLSIPRPGTTDVDSLISAQKNQVWIGGRVFRVWATGATEEHRPFSLFYVFYNSKQYRYDAFIIYVRILKHDARSCVFMIFLKLKQFGETIIEINDLFYLLTDNSSYYFGIWNKCLDDIDEDIAAHPSNSLSECLQSCSSYDYAFVKVS